MNDILKRISDGDKHAFDLLFKQYYSILRAYAKQITLDIAVADDIVQDIFFNLWINRTKIIEIDNIGAYLRTSVHNRAINYLKSEKRQLKNVEKINNYLELEKLHLEILQYRQDSISDKELMAQIAQTINNLPEQCQKVFKLSRNFNMKNAEIAVYFGISVKAVEKHITKALRHLREELVNFVILLLIWLYLK